MGWFGKSSKEASKPEAEAQSPPGAPKQLLLEDLPPRVEDETGTKVPPKPPAQPTLKDAIDTISSDDFKKVHTIPCFRQGMLAGIGVGTVASIVLLVMRSPLSKGLNWGMGSFFVGSVASWEQCRAKMRQEKRNTQMLKTVLRKKAEEAVDSTEIPPKPSK